MKRLCTSKSLIPCPAKLEGKLKTEAKRLRKEDQKVEGILKEAILNNKNEDGSQEHNKAERNVFEKLE